MKPKDFGKLAKSLAKSYKAPMIVWAKYFADDLDGYADGGAKPWDVLERMAKDRVYPKKVMLAIAMFGELVNEVDESEVQQDLEPYSEPDLYALLHKIAERMRTHTKAPFWQCAGLSAEQYKELLSLIRARMTLHPTNMAKAYAATVRDSETWQDVVVRTFYFANVRAMLERELLAQGGVKAKLAEKGIQAGLVKI